MNRKPVKMNAKDIIDKLNLAEHPEGGYYKETHRSKGKIKGINLPNEFNGDRNYSTCIYFLLTSDRFSSFHKINQDETWHFYKGSTLKLHMISPEGIYSFVYIGNDLFNEEHPQFTVPAQYWFAAEVIDSNSFAFTGCTVAPGFDFDDFVLPNRKDLLMLFPQHYEVITRLTHQ